MAIFTCRVFFFFIFFFLWGNIAEYIV